MQTRLKAANVFFLAPHFHHCSVSLPALIIRPSDTLILIPVLKLSIKNIDTAYLYTSILPLAMSISRCPGKNVRASQEQFSFLMYTPSPYPLMAWKLTHGLMQHIWQEFQFCFLHNRMTQKISTKGVQLNNWQCICNTEMLVRIRNWDWAESYKKLICPKLFVSIFF